MNRRRFLKALFSIPLLAVVPKMAVEEKKVIGQRADIIVLDDYKKIVFPKLPPLVDFWPIPEFYHPNEGLCELFREVDRDATYNLINGTDNPEYEFNGLRDYLTTGKERLQQLDDYSKTPFMEMQIEKMREIINEFVEQSL